jgi:hypothetical protein
MRYLLVAVLTAGITSLSYSQNTNTGTAPDSVAVDSSWTHQASLGINLNQASFSDNWQGGGTNNIAFGIIAKAMANYSEGKHTWDNQALLEFGQQKSTQGGDTWRKTVDQIFLDSKYGYVISGDWNAFGSFNFRSQFAPGYQFGEDDNGDPTQILISNFMAPGFLTEAVGVEYKPNQNFFARFGTGTLRQTLVADQELYDVKPEPADGSPKKLFGVEEGEYIRNELAFQLDMGYTRKLMENISLQSRYLMFANYETITEVNTIDHRLDAIITLQVNDFVNVTLSGTFLYDEDQIAKRQWSQASNIGFLISY